MKRDYYEHLQVGRIVAWHELRQEIKEVRCLSQLINERVLALCVCVCVCERERERELVVEERMDKINSLHCLSTSGDDAVLYV